MLRRIAQRRSVPFRHLGGKSVASDRTSCGLHYLLVRSTDRRTRRQLLIAANRFLKRCILANVRQGGINAFPEGLREGDTLRKWESQCFTRELLFGHSKW